MLAACLLVAVAQTEKPTLELFQEAFIVRNGRAKWEVPLKLPPEIPKRVAPFRKDQTYAVWDERGLTTRTGKDSLSSRLPDIPTSPKLFERLDIIDTIARIKEGGRKAEATALSGAVRIGNYAYFLPRWQEKTGKPWLEALVRVDLTEHRPKAVLMGRFEGLTLSTDPIDTQLFIQAGQIRAIVKNEMGDWGYGVYAPDTKEFSFIKLGVGVSHTLTIAPRTLMAFENTDYGATVVRKIYADNASSRTLMESRGTVKFLDTQPPYLAIITNSQGTLLRNLETGSEVKLPASSAVRRSKGGVVVWSPLDKPQQAWLYDPVRWNVQANWRPKP